MKVKFHRIILCIFAFSLLSQFFSCTKNDVNDTAILHPSITDATYYVKENIGLDENFYASGALFRSENYVYLNGSISGDGTMLIYNLTDESVKYELLPAIYSNTVALAGNENRYYILYNAYNELDDSYQHKISYIQDGALVFDNPLSNYLSLLPSDFHGNICAIYAEGKLYLAAATQFAVVSNDDVITFDLPKQIISLCKTRSGNIYVIGNDYIYLYNVESGAFTEDIEKSREISELNADNYYMGEGYDIYYSTLNGLYGYNFGTNSPATILSWIGSGIYYERIDDLILFDPEHIILYGATNQYDEKKLINLSPYEGELPTKQVITVSYIENGSGTIPAAALQFNNSQSQYEVVCEEYVSSTGDDYHTSLNQLDAAILKGELADVFVLNSKEDVDKYGNLGLLLDLYTIIENREDFFQCIREYCETDGSLFGITSDFSISTLIAKETNLPEYDIWNSTAFLNTVDNIKEGQNLFAYSSRNIIQDWVLSSIIWEFLDLENANCSFENEEFIRVLDFLKTLPEDYTTTYEDSKNHYQNDEIIFLSDSPSSFSAYLRIKALFSSNSDINFIGYPSKEGGVVTISPMSFYAINANCTNLDGSYAFIKYLLSSESVINEHKGMQRIPSNKNTLLDWAKSESLLYYFFPYDDISRIQTSLEPFNDTENGYEAHVDETLVQEFSAWLDSIHSAKNLPNDITEIISEELSIFYGTNKTATDTARIIQSRVTIWLSEHN